MPDERLAWWLGGRVALWPRPSTGCESWAGPRHQWPRPVYAAL